MAKDKPLIMMVKEGGKLSPLTPNDAELLDAFADKSEFRIEYASRRSNPMNSLYWVILARVCKATGKWPNDQILHRELMLMTKRYTTSVTLDGQHVRLHPDSAAFKSMNQSEFNDYFKECMALLAEHLGFDPMEAEA